MELLKFMSADRGRVVFVAGLAAYPERVYQEVKEKRPTRLYLILPSRNPSKRDEGNTFVQDEGLDEYIENVLRYFLEKDYIKFLMKEKSIFATRIYSPPDFNVYYSTLYRILKKEAHKGNTVYVEISNFPLIGSLAAVSVASLFPNVVILYRTPSGEVHKFSVSKYGDRIKDEGERTELIPRPIVEDPLKDPMDQRYWVFEALVRASGPVSLGRWVNSDEVLDQLRQILEKAREEGKRIPPKFEEAFIRIERGERAYLRTSMTRIINTLTEEGFVEKTGGRPYQVRLTEAGAALARAAKGLVGGFDLEPIPLLSLESAENLVRGEPSV
ncbi:MAG: hypothetical protein QI223_08075 [Candidatus Korarchaeota archaeon]|nr:hypothetical protein [Candidatus Korarchaeota archaeon]